MKLRKLLLSLVVAIGGLTAVNAQLDYAAKPYIPPADYRLQVIYVGNFKPSTVQAHDNNERWDWVNANLMRIDTNLVRLNNGGIPPGGGTGTSYWERNSTSLSPDTEGDDILLRSADEYLYFGSISTYIRLNGTNLTFADIASGSVYTLTQLATDSVGSVTFLGDSDTPSTYSGQALKSTRVNAGETALEFYTPVSGGGGGTVVDSMIYQTCPYNDTTLITIGDTAETVYIRGVYNSHRNIGGTSSRSGDFKVHYDTFNDTVIYSDDYRGPSIGYEIQAARYDDSIKLLIIVDAAYSNDLTFGHGVVTATGLVFYGDQVAAGTGDTNREVNYTLCIYNSTTNIVLGSATEDVSYKLHYVCERNMGTIQKVMGNIDIIYDDVSGVVYYYPDQIPSTTIIDLGLTITADVNFGDIRLNIAVDNTNTNNLQFDKKIISRFYE